VNTFSSHLIDEIWTPTPRIDFYVNKIVQESQDKDVAFLNLLWDGVDFDYWKQNLVLLLQQVNHQLPNLKIVLIVNSWYKHYQDQILKLPNVNSVYFIDFHLLLMYRRVIELKESEWCSDWDSSQNKFLFLTGKPAKTHRIKLLYLLDKQGMLDHSIWSLFVPDNLFDSCHKLLPELTVPELEQWITQYQRNPDNADILTYPNGNIHYAGVPYNVEMYKNTKFHLISETWFEVPDLSISPWITEKTWLPILNNRPFIMASQPYTLKKLKQRGFRTFEKYCLHTDYDDIVNHEQRLQAIIENIKHWQQTTALDCKEVNADITHNFQLLVRLANENQATLEQAMAEYNISTSIYNIVPVIAHMQYFQWKYWYGRIKDPTWPDCDKEEHFALLPKWIQKECIEVHGYNPEKT
jgi:hypothetical protein